MIDVKFQCNYCNKEDWVTLTGHDNFHSSFSSHFPAGWEIDTDGMAMDLICNHCVHAKDHPDCPFLAEQKRLRND